MVARLDGFDALAERAEVVNSANRAPSQLHDRPAGVDDRRRAARELGIDA